MVVVALRAFLEEAGLSGYEHALKEAGIRTANDILEVERPLELLQLSYLEEQCVQPSRCVLQYSCRWLSTGASVKLFLTRAPG